MRPIVLQNRLKNCVYGVYIKWGKFLKEVCFKGLQPNEKEKFTLKTMKSNTGAHH